MRIFVVDAFVTEEPFTGNPAAVVCVEGGGAEVMTDKFRQGLAFEMNLSETAYVRPIEDGRVYELRWFTPEAEVDLCGHATLAAAKVALDEMGWGADGRVAFSTRSGILAVEKVAGGMFCMDFPRLSYRVQAEKSHWEIKVLGALGVEPLRAVIAHSDDDLLVEVDSTACLEALDPDQSALHNLLVNQDGAQWRGVIVTARSTHEGADFCSRCFFPHFGIPEDPVTGSAHCVLAPYWQEKLGRAPSDELSGLQGKRRRGRVSVRQKEARVLLGGNARVVIDGQLRPL